MSPRPYRMGRRAAAVEETRRRIRAAALAEYARSGVDGASMQAIARRADVAPGTVLNHYPDPAALADDVIAHRIEELEVPTAGDVDPGAPRRDRVERLTRGMFRVYAATDLEYQAWTRSREHPVMRRYEEWYNGVYAAALAAALGPDACPRAFQVVSAVVDPGFRAALLQRGLAEEEAVGVVTELAVAWLERGTGGTVPRGSDDE